MNSSFFISICKATGASRIKHSRVIQPLWSGYGTIERCELDGGEHASVVVKHVCWPQKNANGKMGGNSSIGHKRKVRSYRVEMAFYDQYSKLCTNDCRVPHCLHMETVQGESLLVLEDLHQAGFTHRKSSLSMKEMEPCIKWLAEFHAVFMNKVPQNLWHTGTYWHLATRPDELRQMDDDALRRAAPAIDALLCASPYQTFVHGDAKLSNFCFTPNGRQVAAVDFQYVGGGCGIKDLVYLAGSCMYDEQCEKFESDIKGVYFAALQKALLRNHSEFKIEDVRASWEPLYEVAWADFHRFLKGWALERYAKDSYSERVCRRVLEQL
jgi:thiamine kinase-like enzyme